MVFAILGWLKKHWVEDSGIFLANPGILCIDSRSLFGNEKQ